MDGVIVIAVLSAALLHASWNLLVKLNDDRLVAIGLISVSQGLIASTLLLNFDVPAVESWPFLASSIFLHVGYQVFLARAYSHGDLSQVYPLARGSAPLMTFLGTLLFVGEPISAIAAAGIVVLSVGVISLVFAKTDGAHRNRKAIVYALATGLFIASYTVVDGIGARKSESVHGYALWLFVLDSFPILLILLITRGRAFLTAARNNIPTALGGGAMSLCAYWIVIWAMTQAPIAPVAALRETGVIFGALIGTWILKERGGKSRIFAAAVVVFGVIMVRA